MFLPAVLNNVHNLKIVHVFDFTCLCPGVPFHILQQVVAAGKLC